MDPVHESTTTVVTGKRKRALVLRISSSPSPSIDAPVVQNPPASPQGGSSRDVAKPRNKRYRCEFEGCEKAYTKPSRLAEHQRSHTGDRPFVCSVCKRSYLRDSHLQAHARTHLPASARQFVCEEPGCGKRFWTSQHLRAHSKLHTGEKLFKCNEPSCDAAFSKHHQLREHICTVHAHPGTKPYRCEHDGCTKSFATNQALRAHVKTHDDKRYTCAHQSCIPTTDGSLAYFATWSALQHHMRTAHPPTCPYASCNGKTFTTRGHLRAHLKTHAERDLEMDLDNAVYGSAREDDAEPLRKRRRGGEVGLDWVCQELDCGKEFKSKFALNTHHNVKHLGRRDFVCPEPDCQRAFGYKHLLQRHTARFHNDASSTSESEASQGDDEDEEQEQQTLDIDFITGNAYSLRSQARLGDAKVLQCPHPNLPAELSGADTPVPSSSSASSTCCYVFSRAYDFKRHLLSEHGLEVERERLDRWVHNAKTQKLAASGTT
ncbi:hypothetical protein WOLCODRAFT_112004 [Wolfiporia cocos MD-104 SS10]|uniref:C2H2-type domain-containing protein n=1 Tax=Wolfiporia cocos (strain MD-104) TaxID=742152 RepID=A0A2H3J7B5_WOLCO|nr:hypothetical protein WOLCODRAFT_112004 [Wolfiporia cocos MD-104 SS10]